MIEHIALDAPIVSLVLLRGLLRVTTLDQLLACLCVNADQLGFLTSVSLEVDGRCTML